MNFLLNIVSSSRAGSYIVKPGGFTNSTTTHYAHASQLGGSYGLRWEGSRIQILLLCPSSWCSTYRRLFLGGIGSQHINRILSSEDKGRWRFFSACVSRVVPWDIELIWLNIRTSMFLNVSQLVWTFHLDYRQDTDPPSCREPVREWLSMSIWMRGRDIAVLPIDDLMRPAEVNSSIAQRWILLHPCTPDKKNKKWGI